MARGLISVADFCRDKMESLEYLAQRRGKSPCLPFPLSRLIAGRWRLAAYSFLQFKFSNPFLLVLGSQEPQLSKS